MRSPRSTGREVNTVPAGTRCRPSMRMSLTANASGPTGAATTGSGEAGIANGLAAWANTVGAAAVAAEARARASRRRGGSRVIITSGWGRGRAGRVGASVQQLQDVVVERQAHQPGEHRQSDVLPGDHRPFAQRAAFGKLDK